MPAGPTTETRRARRSRLVAWNRSLSSLSSSSRPTNGASRASERPLPPRSATTRRARQAGTVDAFPLSACSPAGSKAIATDAARCVASPTSTVPGAAADCSLEAVLTRSPATMPWPDGTQGHRRLAGQHPGTRRDAGSQRAHRVDEIERRSDGPLGIILAGDRRTPDGHDRIADELLDRPAVTLDDVARQVEVPRQELPGVLRVATISERRETHEVGEQRSKRRGARRRERAGPRMVFVSAVDEDGGSAVASRVAHSPQNFSAASFRAPHAGQTAASADAHSEQNLRPTRFSVPQLPQITREPRMTSWAGAYRRGTAWTRWPHQRAPLLLVGTAKVT